MSMCAGADLFKSLGQIQTPVAACREDDDANSAILTTNVHDHRISTAPDTIFVALSLPKLDLIRIQSVVNSSHHCSYNT
eukprot:scaffold16134_cov144-Skeletonema_dohrnii-CCMP3373.AAC.3